MISYKVHFLFASVLVFAEAKIKYEDSFIAIPDYLTKERCIDIREKHTVPTDTVMQCNVKEIVNATLNSFLGPKRKCGDNFCYSFYKYSLNLQISFLTLRFPGPASAACFHRPGGE